MNRALEIYEPILSLINKLKVASPEEKPDLLEKLYAEAEIAYKKFKALDEEVNKLIKETKSLTDLIEGLTKDFY